MNPTIQKVITWVLIFATILFVTYIAYQFYNYAVADATARIQEGVSQGVSQGITGGIGNTINPLKWFGGNR